MLGASALILMGIVIISWAADRTVTGAAALARNMGISPLLVGLTIVAIGTSAPEVFVAITASWQGNPELAIGNAIGSNIANIGLVLGIATLITPMEVKSKLLRREYPILLLIMFIAWLLMVDGDLNRFDGTILIIGSVVAMGWLIYLGLQERNHEPMSEEFQQEMPRGMSNQIAMIWLAIGLCLLPLGSYFLVNGATTIAEYFGISSFIIGVTVVAIGTSIPEVAAAIAAAIQKEHDIAIGNILGSNMFNMLLVLGLPAIIQPSDLNVQVLVRDMPMMFGLTILLFLVSYGWRSHGRIRRWEGGLLLACYIFYIRLLFV